MKTLAEESEVNEDMDFQFIELNAMRLLEPRQAYSAIWKKVSGSHVAPDNASKLLSKRFTGVKGIDKRRFMYVLKVCGNDYTEY